MGAGLKVGYRTQKCGVVHPSAWLNCAEHPPSIQSSVWVDLKVTKMGKSPANLTVLIEGEDVF